MMHGRGKSDEAIVAVKPANKAERSAAELVERRAEAKGNARHQSMLRTLCRVQHVTRDGRMRIIVYLMMRSDPLPSRTRRSRPRGPILTRSCPVRWTERIIDSVPHPGLLGYSSCPAGSNWNFYSWRGGGGGVSAFVARNEGAAGKLRVGSAKGT